MLGHENEADQRKAIASTYFLENLDGHIPDANRAQQRPALIATEGDEMQVTPAADTFQMVRHNIRGRGAHPLPKAKPQRVGHPGKFSYHCVVLFTSGYFGSAREMEQPEAKGVPPASYDEDQTCTIRT
jgi:hypothetical protein